MLNPGCMLMSAVLELILLLCNCNINASINAEKRQCIYYSFLVNILLSAVLMSQRMFKVAPRLSSPYPVRYAIKHVR